MAKQKLMVVLGTRPEAIKLAPLVLAARAREDFGVVLCNTGQHRELTAQVLNLFGLVADVDLDLMRHHQTLTAITARVLAHLPQYLESIRPDWLIVQGDTTTTLAAALAAFYQKIPVAHVEAGLRTGHMYSPWPEEINRRLVSAIASLHFSPTALAAENLHREGVAAERILVTGNTGIDALKWVTARLFSDESLRTTAREAEVQLGVPALNAAEARPYVLITGHRRESFGSGLEAICHAIAQLAARHASHEFIYAVHPNPSVAETVFARLGAERRRNIHLLPPLDYLPFVDLMSRADLILTDSGGVQEEAPSLGKRVVVLRDVTERPESLGTGLTRLAGTDPARIVAFADDALCGQWQATGGGTDVYGDGRACHRILDRLATASAGVVR